MSVAGRSSDAKRKGRARRPSRGGLGTATLRLTYALLGCLLLTYLGLLISQSSSELIDGWAVVSLELVASGLCIASGPRRRAVRAVPLVLGASLLSWTFGDTALTIESLGGATPPTPSVADAFYLTFFVLAYVALVLYVRGEVRRLATPNWLDGGIAALGAAALCAAFAFHAIETLTREGVLATAVNLAYPLGDVLLLTLVVGGTALLAGRSRGPWLLLAGGIGLNVVGDTFNLLQSSVGSSHVGTVVNGIAWPTAIWMMSMSMWLPRGRSDPLAAQKPTGFLLSGVAAACGLAILVAGTLEHVNGVAIGLATAALALVCIRTGTSVRALRALTRERQRLSVTDQLTGLGNRRHLFDVLDAFFAEEIAAPEPRRLAFLFVDLEHFKEINDSFGHPAGDEILKQAGERLAESLQPSDVLARLGGDEFAAVLVDADADYAVTVSRRISASLARPFALAAVQARLGASIGIALAPSDASDSAGLIWCADVAMYQAKFGAVPFALYKQELDKTGDRLRLAQELRSALEAGELVVHYQPQLDLRTGAICSVEALVRWPHPTLGLVPPMKFLPLAEEAGLMSSVTRLVLDQALAQCAAWRASGRQISVSVNVSPSDLRESQLPEVIFDLLQRHELDARSLIVEITETSVITDFERARDAVRSLRQGGIAVSVDDFGAGFTSLAYLSGLDIGELKLDRALIAQLTGADGHRGFGLVRATIELGHALGLSVVAEGIESRATLELVSELGCDRGQGYFIGTPKPASRLALRSVAERDPRTHSERRRADGHRRRLARSG
jgi:diguanylate cyclase (GGDEF)-like protein